MADPTATGELLGIKLAPLIAGFAGSVLSLSFIQGLTWRQAILALASGVACALWVTPLAMEFFGVPPKVENGLAFIMGVGGMSILGGIVKLARGFADDPRSLLRRGANGGGQ